MNIVTDADPLFGFISNTGLWRSNASVPDLTAITDEVDRLHTAIESDGLQQVGRADNVVITGSTTAGNTFVDLLESAFSNIDPDVVAVGENITTLGPVQQGSSFAAPQVAGLASYLWLLSDDLRDSQPISITRRAIFENARELPLAGRVIDAYATVLSLDAAVLPTPESAPVRPAILDLNNDGVFDEHDVSAFVGVLLDSNGRPIANPATPVYDRFDLNGDGFTGGSRTERFDLDPTGSAQFGAPSLSQVTTNVGGTDRTFDESAVTDTDILCYYAYSALYTGDPGARDQILLHLCGTCQAVVIHDHFERFTAGPGEIFLDVTVHFNYTGGTVILSQDPDGTGDLHADDEMILTVTHPDLSVASLDQDYSNGCSGSVGSTPPQDVTALFQPGNNTVRAQFKNTCGGNASADGYALVSCGGR